MILEDGLKIVLHHFDEKQKGLGKFWYMHEQVARPGQSYDVLLCLLVFSLLAGKTLQLIMTSMFAMEQDNFLIPPSLPLIPLAMYHYDMI